MMNSFTHLGSNVFAITSVRPSSTTWASTVVQYTTNMGSLFDIMSLFRKPFAANDNPHFVERPPDPPCRGFWLKAGEIERLSIVLVEVLLELLQLNTASFRSPCT